MRKSGTKCCACLRRGANLEPLNYKACTRDVYFGSTAISFMPKAKIVQSVFFLVGRRFSRVRRFEKTESKNWSVQLWNYSAFYLALAYLLIWWHGIWTVRIRTRLNWDKHAQKRIKSCTCLRRGANLGPLDYKSITATIRFAQRL